MNALRAGLLVLVVGSSALVAFGLFGDTGAMRLPMVVSGLVVLGIASGILGFSLASSAVRLGEGGHGGRALLAAFVGGLFVLMASGALAGAIVLGILTGAT